MIRILPFILLLVFDSVFGQGSESFSISNLTDNYSDGTFLGETNGVNISYFHCRNAGEFTIDGAGIMLRRNDSDPISSSVEIQIPNGVGEFTFQYRKAFTVDNNRILSVSVNDDEVFLSPIFGNTSGVDPTIYTQTIPIYKQGNVVIKIGYPSTISNGNRNVTLDNFSWTKVLPNPTALPSNYISVDNFISNWEYAFDFSSFEIHVSDYKYRLFTQTESFEQGLDTSGYENLWEADLIGGRWILDNVLRTTQRATGNYGAQLQADFGKLISPVFQKPNSISFYAKKGANDTSLNLSIKTGNTITSLSDFQITNTEFQLFSYTLTQIPEEASFIFTNGAKVLYMDDLSIETEGFIKLPLDNSPFQSLTNSFSHQIQNLDPDTKYFYKIRAKHNSDLSGFSDEIELNTKDGVIWNGNIWQFGNPTENKVAVLRGSGDNLTSFKANSLQVEHDIEIPATTSIHLVNEFQNYFNQSILFNEGAYLIQDNNLSTNLGNASFKRTATFFGYDSKFWSSPVRGQKIIKSTLNDQSGFIPNPLAIYTYNESGRNWLRTTDTLFQQPKGYIIQLGTNYPFMGQGQEAAFDGIFTGVPNNGEYTFSAQKTNLGDNGIGNPYASPISMEIFMQNNPTVKTLYFWNEDAHYIPGSNPASYLGQTWFSYNRTGSNVGPKTHIGSGVGFIARVTADSEIIFNNSMREVVEFNQSQNKNSIEKDRFWLSLNVMGNKENQILIGYIAGATNGIDEMYDAKNMSNNNSFILSHSNNNAMTIEGRQYPLDINDQIPLFFRASKKNLYTIKLENTEGVFKTQPIYLIDNEENLIVNLKDDTDYLFKATTGDYPNRFQIVYKIDEVLSTDNSAEKLNLTIYKNNGVSNVLSNYKIVEYNVYSLDGKRIISKKQINSKKINLIDLDNGFYVVKFLFENGKEIYRKIIL